MITLVLGGARSGKSAVAERLAGASTPPVTYVATLVVGDDADLAARVERHRARRRASWHTLEVGDDLVSVLREVTGTVLVDSLGPWVASLGRGGDAARGDADAVDAAGRRLCDALCDRDGDTVVVSEEVGLSVHPSSAWGRRFRDDLGTVNQAVASCAADVLLVVAGRVLRLEDAGRDG